MTVAGVRELYESAGTALRSPLCPINLMVAVELTIKIRRPYRMDGPAVNVTDFSMPMVRFRMDMKQGSREHPQRRPG